MLGQKTNKPFYVSFNPNGNKVFKKRELITFAPFKNTLMVIEIYKDNIFKRALRKLGFKTRFNQLKVIKR